MSYRKRFQELCAEHDFEIPSDAIVLAVLDAAQQVQLLHQRAANFSPTLLDTELIGTQLMIWCLARPSSRYIVPPADVPSNSLAKAIQL